MTMSNRVVYPNVMKAKASVARKDIIRRLNKFTPQYDVIRDDTIRHTDLQIVSGWAPTSQYRKNQTIWIKVQLAFTRF
jgi:hypothetical protein